VAHSFDHNPSNNHFYLRSGLKSSYIDKEFLLDCIQRVRVREQLLEEVTATSGVLHGSVLGPLLFLASVNDIWRNIEPTIRLFADDCINDLGNGQLKMR
jgi:hypothetical protein